MSTDTDGGTEFTVSSTRKYAEKEVDQYRDCKRETIHQ